MFGNQDAFKFSFFASTDSNIDNAKGKNCSKKDASEFIISHHDKSSDQVPSVDTVTLCDGSRLSYVNCSEVETKISSIKESHLQEAFQQRSDLVPNVYEGGLKIWEGSLDLVEYLCENKVDFCHKTVLELGCGAALPGLFALKNGANVHFQDYNEEVLEHMTVANALLTGGEEGVRRCKFYSGDWASLTQLLTRDKHNPVKYDMILTAETIYSPDSYKDLHSILCSLLKPTGIIYLAAKVYYFGVGGGIREFEDIVTKEGILKSRIVKTIDEGVKREVLKIRFKNKE